MQKLLLLVAFLLATCTCSMASLVTLKFPLSAMMEFNSLFEEGEKCYQSDGVIAENHSFNGCIALIDEANDFRASDCAKALFALKPTEDNSTAVIDACFPTIGGEREFKCGDNSLCMCDKGQSCATHDNCASKYCLTVNDTSTCAETGLTWKIESSKMQQYHVILETAACSGASSAPIASMHTYVGCVLQTPSSFASVEAWKNSTCGAAIAELGIERYVVPYDKCFPITEGTTGTAHGDVLCPADKDQECDDTTICGGKYQCLEDKNAHNDLKVMHHVRTCQNSALRVGGMVMALIVTLLAIVALF